MQSYESHGCVDGPGLGIELTVVKAGQVNASTEETAAVTDATRWLFFRFLWCNDFKLLSLRYAWLVNTLAVSKHPCFSVHQAHGSSGVDWWRIFDNILVTAFLIDFVTERRRATGVIFSSGYIKVHA